MLRRRKGSREADTWLSDAQLAQCARADEAAIFHSPVPTRMISNGEYLPVPQTVEQQRVEARIQELATASAKKLGMSRRQFLASTGGLAAAFLAMNEVFGRFFHVDPIELFEPAAFAANGAPANLFVLDDQLHLVRSSIGTDQMALRAIAQGPTAMVSGVPANPFNPEDLPDELGDPWTPWNPALIGLPITPEIFHLVPFIKDVYLDSQVTVGLLSNVTSFVPGFVPPDLQPPKNIQEAQAVEILTAAQTVGVRNFVNQLAGSPRLLAHGLLYVGVGNLDFIQYQIEVLQPDAWKGYNITFAAKVDLDPDSPMQQWRLDDEAVAYPTYERISQHQAAHQQTQPGFGNICVHKGLAPVPPDTPEQGNPTDIPKAATDWPNLNFIIYHSAIQPLIFMFDALQEIRSGVLRNGVPDIRWTTQFAQLAQPFPNVYAELGTTFASTVITFPTVTAHLLGQLLTFMGPARILFGSDSVWYGSPQWQIEAFWRFQIPDAMREQYHYPALTEAAKRLILGLNAAELYGVRPTPGVYQPVPADYEAQIPDDLKTLLEFPGFTADNLSTIRTAYQALGAQPSHTRYGWIRTRG
jgi:predicted TIM-barrel fold metal-dependent hydrolase